MSSDSPLGLCLIVITSLVSTFYFFKGYKEKHVPQLLYGVGWGIPAFGIGSFNVWLAAIACCAVGYWLQKKLDGDL